MRAYDAVVRSHYDSVAVQDGAAGTSTMADTYVRDRESAVILKFLSAVASHFANIKYENGVDRRGAASDPLTILDVGCGNGYTLEVMQKNFPPQNYIGIEFNEKLREIAKTRAHVLPGDIRDLSTIEMNPNTADVVICQRVLINLMDREDQKQGLQNIIRLAKPGAKLLFIETFQDELDRLNEARREFGLTDIPPAIHNLPLPHRFFKIPELQPIRLGGFPVEPNDLSTHFFVTRILHEVALRATGSDFIRNSHFVKFMTAALPSGVGNYSPLQFHAFRKAD